MQHKKTPICRFVAVLIAIAATAGSRNLAEADTPDSIAFFEKKIRPVLVANCYECHSGAAEEIGGSLVLDSQDGMMTGGDSGPAIAKGDAEGSALISALRYESSEMPPKGKLSDDVIRDFERWIDAGATDPRQDSHAAKFQSASIDINEGRQFWAFQPIRFQPPAAALRPSSNGMIDDFVLSQLSAAEVEPNATAAAATRLRRLAFDLTGLPPDAGLLAQWIADPSMTHWHRIVDRMLASPEFAEHWARHWMDVARYADSNGSDFNATHHEAWRYRDYLIRCFAADQPIDRMIQQQVAGDLLPFDNPQERYDNIVATTFLMLGTKMLSERDKEKLQMDVVDEQIDTVGRALLGLTLGCARCHDHKFDPVPTEDYYALAGIFKNTVTLKGESQKYVSTWNRVRLPASDEQLQAVAIYNASLKELQSDLKAAEAKLDSLGHAKDETLAGIVVDDQDAKKIGQWKTSTYFKDFVGPGYVHDDNKSKGRNSIEFSVRLPKTGVYEVRLAYAYGSTRSSAVPITIQTSDGEKKLSVDQRTAPISPVWRSLGKFPFSDQSDAIVTLSNEATSGYVIADAVQFLSDEDLHGQTPNTESDDSPKQQLNDQNKAVDALKERLKQLKENAPPKLPEAMATADVADDQLVDSPIHIRGEVRNLGDVVPRGFLQVCSPRDARIEKPSGSGRRELANWLTDPDNPVVARVFVNRVWMYLMGQGIVRTVDNFGLQGERPTHPQLLDALASTFIRDGWQMKPLIRQIVTSAAYQRSSDHSPTNMQLDPENRLLWRMHRRRIPAEAIRDAMLFASGQLDRRARDNQMADHGTLVSSNNADSKANVAGVSEPCRTLYLPTVRGYIPPLLTMLDVADPDLLVGKRPTTNVPAQALVLINSPDVVAWAQRSAEQVMASATGFESRLQEAFLRTLQRDPSWKDREIANAFFADREDSIETWREYIAALYASTEFRLLD
ncbi:MAG: DUF1553 domain-containing protein [Pirellulaceae bacterium]